MRIQLKVNKKTLKTELLRMFLFVRVIQACYTVISLGGHGYTHMFVCACM